MRTTFDSASVRLYHVSDEPGLASASTLLYDSLEEAIRVAAEQPEEVQAGLFIATDNDVIAWLELREGI